MYSQTTASDSVNCSNISLFAEDKESIPVSVVKVSIHFNAQCVFKYIT